MGVEMENSEALLRVVGPEEELTKGHRHEKDALFYSRRAHLPSLSSGDYPRTVQTPTNLPKSTTQIECLSGVDVVTSGWVS